LHTWEGNLAIPAASNLKRPRTLPNRSREDRIRDWAIQENGVRSMTFDLAAFWQRQEWDEESSN
jgi:hypothetical protein